MSSIEEKIARAKKSQTENRPHRDVSVTLDAGLSAERDALEAERAALQDEFDAAEKAAADSLAPADTADLEKRLAKIDAKLRNVAARELDTLIVVRVYKLPGDLWAEATVRHPMREGALFDSRYGYNIHALTKEVVAAFGRLVEGDVEKQLDPEQWDAIWPLLGGSEFGAIADQVFALNVLEPAARSARLKNSYEAALASAKK